MRISANKSVNKNTCKQAIRDKMRCLDDFGICDIHDKTMIAKLEQALAEKPDKDPQEVLDYFCRPMIQAKADSWDD